MYSDIFHFIRRKGIDFSLRFIIQTMSATDIFLLDSKCAIRTLGKFKYLKKYKNIFKKLLTNCKVYGIIFSKVINYVVQNGLEAIDDSQKS